VRGKEGIEHGLVGEQTIGLVGGRSGNLGSESNQCLEARETVDPHAEIDDREFGILREINGEAIDLGRHESFLVNR
jgi:hypothetical protein